MCVNNPKPKLCFIRPIIMHCGGAKVIWSQIHFIPSPSFMLSPNWLKKWLKSSMDHFQLWNGNLHSYRKRLGMTTALAQVCNNREIEAAIDIDKSAAFDSLSHEILLDKLQLYNMHEDTIRWIKDYLEVRTQYITIGSKDSVLKAVTTGVPPGSILGPILFNIYRNNFPEIANNHETCAEVAHNP